MSCDCVRIRGVTSTSVLLLSLLGRAKLKARLSFFDLGDAAEVDATGGAGRLDEAEAGYDERRLLADDDERLHSRSAALYPLRVTTSGGTRSRPWSGASCPASSRTGLTPDACLIRGSRAATCEILWLSGSISLSLSVSKLQPVLLLLLLVPQRSAPAWWWLRLLLLQGDIAKHGGMAS